MKKAIASLLIVVLSLCLFGCGKGNSEQNTADKGKYDDSLIEELYAEDGSYTNQWEAKTEYSFHVPQLISDSEEAKKINDEIKGNVGVIVEESLNYIQNEEDCGFYSVSWESHWQESVVYLVLKVDLYSDFSDYSVYVYDFASEKRLDNAEILQAAGVTEEEFLQATRCSAAACFDEMYGDFKFDEWYDYGCLEMRALTLSDELINNELNRYIDDDGALTVIAPIGSVAGSSWYYHELKPDFHRENVSDSADFDFVHAALKDGKVTVSFKKTEESKMHMYGRDVEFDKEYQVQGLNSTYNKIYLGNFGQNFCPYILLVSDDGHVEYVNILSGIWHGYLCASGSVPGITDVVSLEEGEFKDVDGSCIETHFAVKKNGEKVCLFEPLTDMERRVSKWYMEGSWVSDKVIHSVDGGGSYESEYCLDIAEENMAFNVTDLNEAADIVLFYPGYILYLGMNENGLIYYFNLYDETNMESYEGIMAFKQSDEGISVKILGGEEIFDSQKTHVTEFTRAFG